MPPTAYTVGTCCRKIRPTRAAKAGSRLISVPKAPAVSRRSDSISIVKGITGTSSASPMPMTTSSQLRLPTSDGPATNVAVMPATGIEMPRPCRPSTSSPTRWVSRMYAAQQQAAARAKAIPAASTPPCQGSVSSTTPIAARAGHHKVRPPPRTTATPSGPRNSNALAVPSGSRATASMNRIVTPAVTTPSATHAANDDRVNDEGRGRTMTRNKTPAHASRSQATTTGSAWSSTPTAAAAPSWTQSIEPSASSAPVRASAERWRRWTGSPG